MREWAPWIRSRGAIILSRNHYVIILSRGVVIKSRRVHFTLSRGVVIRTRSEHWLVLSLNLSNFCFGLFLQIHTWLNKCISNWILRYHIKIWISCLLYCVLGWLIRISFWHFEILWRKIWIFSNFLNSLNVSNISKKSSNFSTYYYDFCQKILHLQKIRALRHF